MQTAIIVYSQTESYYLILESRQMEGAQSHPLSHVLALSVSPFLCKANLEGRAREAEDIMVREGKKGARGG